VQCQNRQHPFLHDSLAHVFIVRLPNNPANANGFRISLRRAPPFRHLWPTRFFRSFSIYAVSVFYSKKFRFLPNIRILGQNSEPDRFLNFRPFLSLTDKHVFFQTRTLRLPDSFLSTTFWPVIFQCPRPLYVINAGFTKFISATRPILPKQHVFSSPHSTR